MKVSAKADQWVANGEQAQRQGRMGEAAKAFQQALVCDPDYPPALRRLGEIWLQQGMPDIARPLLERAAALIPEDAGLWRVLGQLHERQGRVGPAADAWRRVTALKSQDRAAWSILAGLLGRMGDADGARQALEHLLGIDPDHQPSRIALLRDAYQRNDDEQVSLHFEQARLRNGRIVEDMRPGFALPHTGAPAAQDPIVRLDVASMADPVRVKEVIAGADLHIFDDFLENPHAMREWARELPFAQTGNFPGLQTGPLDCHALMQRLADHLGQRIKWISPDNGVVRLTLGDASARTDIHVDDEQAVETNTYAAVLYLTAPEHCAGGTSFWRHRPTGWAKRPPEADIRAAGYADFKTFLRRETPATEVKRFGELMAQRSDWERLFTLPMRFNRLVLYKGNYFHAIDSVFGSSFEDGRLTRLFTFERY